MRNNAITQLAIGAMMVAGLAQAQQTVLPPVSQHPALGRIEIPDSNYEIVFGMAELVPGPSAGRRAQGSVVTVYIANGEFLYLIDGQARQPFRVGDLAQVPESAFPTDGDGNAAAAAMAVYIVEKPKPAASTLLRPAQAPAATAGTPREQLLVSFDHLPEPALATAFLQCDREARARLLAMDEGVRCAMAWDALLRRVFANDVDALIAWWKVHRQEVKLDQAPDPAIASRSRGSRPAR